MLTPLIVLGTLLASASPATVVIPHRVFGWIEQFNDVVYFDIVQQWEEEDRGTDTNYHTWSERATDSQECEGYSSENQPAWAGMFESLVPRFHHKDHTHGQIVSGAWIMKRRLTTLYVQGYNQWGWQVPATGNVSLSVSRTALEVYNSFEWQSFRQEDEGGF